MKSNKRGERHIQLKDDDCILCVEQLARDMRCTLYEATEKIISDWMKHEASEECVRQYDYGTQVIDKITSTIGVVTGFINHYGHAPNQYIIEGSDLKNRPFKMRADADRLEAVKRK